MARPAFLRNITHRALWVATLVGTVGLAVYWVFLREPSTEWRVLVLGMLLSMALGWWPLVSAVVGSLLAVVAWFVAPSEGVEPLQLAEEVLCFIAVGLGWGVLLRGLWQPTRPVPPGPATSRGAEPAKPFDPFAGGRNQAPPAVPPPRTMPSSATPAPATFPAAAPVPPPASPSVPDRPPKAAVAPEVVAHPPSPSEPLPKPVMEESTSDFLLPNLQMAAGAVPPSPAPVVPPRPEPAQRTAPAPRPVEEPPPAAVPPQPQAAPVPLAAPLFTQEVDLGDFRAFVAAQQAAGKSPESAETMALPVNRISGRSSEARTPLNPVPPVASPNSSTVDSSSGGGDASPPSPPPRRTSAVARPETVPGASFEVVLEWYNQFSWSPWKPEELERRYHRPGQKVGWDVLALQDLVRTWKAWQAGPAPKTSEPGQTSLFELEGFLHCEMQGLLRSQGHPDLNLHSQEERSETWMAVYRETRGRIRGGAPVLRPIPDDLQTIDPERQVTGRPDALVEIGGECDVIAFVTPYSPSESMAWSNVLACAQYKLAERLGVVVTQNPIVIRLPMPFWDERRQPRLHEVEERTTELRKLDAALERFHRIRAGALQPRPQTHPSVCNGCGSRLVCRSYTGTRPRVDLANPPPLLRKFLQ